MSELSPSEKKKIQKRIKQLSMEIERHDRLYYQDAKPEISDFEYDCLKSELIDLESRVKDSSWGQKIGDDHLEGALTFPHLTPMLSLENTYNLQDVLTFDQRIKKIIASGESPEYVVEPKIDGVAVNLIYENGVLRRALTRGDGLQGDDVTDNAKTIENLPQFLEGVPETIEIRGEIFLNYATFEAINKERAALGDELFANARNLAAGTIKLMDSEIVKDRYLQLITYGIGYGNSFQAQDEIYAFLEKHHFKTQTSYVIVKSSSEFISAIERLDRERENLTYPTDGAVFKVRDIALQRQLGSTSRAPRWAFAYKFAPQRARTILKSITLQIGRTGAITPVAELQPVLLSGSMISRATLHNFDDINRKDIREGDAVFIEKSGEIIPAVVGVDLDARDGTQLSYKNPTICPCCKSRLIRDPNEVVLKCPNKHCPEQIVQKLIYFVSKSAMDIDNLGEANIRKLVELGKLYDLADVFALKRKDLMQLEKSGEKSANNLLNSLENKKNIELWRLLNGLGIPLIGERTARDLANHFGSFQAVRSATVDDFLKIHGIGEKAAYRLFEFFSDAENSQMIEKLLSLGVQPKVKEAKVGGRLSGKIFVLTGTLDSLSREEAKKIIEENGGRVTASISGKVDIVLAGENAGGKLSLAQEKNITIWDEKTFLNSTE